MLSSISAINQNVQVLQTVCCRLFSRDLISNVNTMPKGMCVIRKREKNVSLCQYSFIYFTSYQYSKQYSDYQFSSQEFEQNWHNFAISKKMRRQNYPRNKVNVDLFIVQQVMLQVFVLVFHLQNRLLALLLIYTRDSKLRSLLLQLIPNPSVLLSTF